jgi:hypothetical protein
MLEKLPQNINTKMQGNGQEENGEKHAKGLYMSS